MIRGLVFVNHRLFTLDPRAIQHIMSQVDLYAKPGILRRLLKRYMADGMITAEGHRHKVQRKASQKLFSSNAMRSMAVVVQVKTDQVSRPGSATVKPRHRLSCLFLHNHRTAQKHFQRSMCESKFDDPLRHAFQARSGDRYEGDRLVRLDPAIDLRYHR